MADALVDNDVLFKTTSYSLATDLLDSHPYGADNFHILAAARFMLPKRLQKHPPARGLDVVLMEFEEILRRVNFLEPTTEEVELAAEFEFIATKAGRELDSGESQLCAILLLRKWDFIFTGDKRAIHAVEQLIEERCPEMQGKISCLEQLIAHLLGFFDFNEVRRKICSELGTDKTLTSCFACRSEASSLETCLEGLNSYIRAIKGQSPKALLNRPT
jgi:hypothetical protein